MQDPSIPIGFHNGRIVPADQITISVADAGFIMGATVTEQLRTFRGEVFRLEQHLARLQQSLEIVEVEPGFSLDVLSDAIQQIVEHNRAILQPDDDVGVNIFVTPGPYSTMAQGGDVGPTVGIISYPLPFDQWSEHYASGQSLVTTSIRQVPASSWPAELKCRSRMHYFLADREARRANPRGHALLLDQDGSVAETPIANVVAFFDGEGLISPPDKAILSGISLGFLAFLAADLSIPWNTRVLTIDDLRQADEVLLTSTPFCVQPAVRLDSDAISSGRPGPIYVRLLDRWSHVVGVDIADQATQHARRR